MKRISILLMAATTFAVPACGSGVSGGGDDGSGSDLGSGSGSGSADQYTQILNSRQVDYNAALKIASLRLTGSVPSLADINSIASLTDPTAQQAQYNTLITTYMAAPTFGRQMYYWWQDQMKIGDSAAFNTAPAFAAELAVNNGSYMDLFTGTTNLCPTYDDKAMTFTDGPCTTQVGSGAAMPAQGPQVGVLSNPGVMAQFYSNYGFRRARWTQEVWDCTSYPAEISTTPSDVGGSAPYTGVFPFASIAGTDNGGRTNFHDVSAIICADCHSDINHRAPLFGYYDMNGVYSTTLAVPTPLPAVKGVIPTAVMTDYLPAGEGTAWKFGVPATDLTALGADMAADPGVAACGVARVWNWALGKGDIVDELETVPTDTIQAQITAFTTGGFKMKDLIYAVYTSDDFVKF